MISRDTSRESDRLLTELYRAMTPAEKVALVFSAYRTGRKIAIAGLKQRFPNDTPPSSFGAAGQGSTSEMSSTKKSIEPPQIIRFINLSVK
jgi:hypothetical protein